MEVRQTSLNPVVSGQTEGQNRPKAESATTQNTTQSALVQGDQASIQNNQQHPTNEMVGNMFTSILGSGIIGGVAGATGAEVINLSLKRFSQPMSAFSFGFSTGIISGAITGAFVSSAVNSEIVVGPSKGTVIGAIVGGISGAIAGYVQGGKAGALMAGISGAIGGAGSGYATYKLQTLDGGQ